MAENEAEPQAPEPKNILSMKEGYKTTEFWIAVVMLLVGCFLVGKGQDEIGAALITVSGLSYQGSRTMAKTRRVA